MEVTTYFSKCNNVHANIPRNEEAETLIKEGCWVLNNKYNSINFLPDCALEAVQLRQRQVG